MHNEDQSLIQIHIEKYDSILAKLSQKTNYQNFLVVFVSMQWVLISLCAMMTSFVFMNPLFECNGK